MVINGYYLNLGYISYNQSTLIYGGFLSHGGTPRHHPFIDGIFYYKPFVLSVSPFMETPTAYSWRNRLAMTGNDWYYLYLIVP